MRELLQSLRFRLRAVPRRRQLERDLQDELAYHLEQRLAHGDQRVPFGNATLIKEDCRQMWTFSHLEDLARELRHAVRVLVRAPAHSLSIVALLALGIGANAAMFSLVNALFIRQLPVHEPASLVAIGPVLATEPFEDFRRQQRSFTGVAATGSMLGTVVSDETGGQMIGVTGSFATGNYFQVLGVHSRLGRLFSEDGAGPANPSFRHPVYCDRHHSGRVQRRAPGPRPGILGASQYAAARQPAGRSAS